MTIDDIQKFLLNIPEDIENDEILGLKIAHIKGISRQTQKTLEKTLDIKSIDDFASKIISPSNLNLLKILGIDKDDLERWQSIANHVRNLVKGTTEVDFHTKILLVGLDNAGKTAILNILTREFNLTNLKPTSDLNITQLTTENVVFQIWDMGGQEKYRQKYINHPERFFVNVQFAIFVIDIQNKNDYDLALNYLIKILDIYESFNEHPDFLIFLHKADPSIYNKIQTELAECESRIKIIFKDRLFEHRVFHTSIYNAIITGDNFARFLHHLFAPEKQDQTLHPLLDSLPHMYNWLVNLSYLLENNQKRLRKLETFNEQLVNVISKKLLKDENLEFEEVKSQKEPELSPREALNRELKQLFQKHRSRKKS